MSEIELTGFAKRLVRINTGLFINNDFQAATGDKKLKVDNPTTGGHLVTVSAAQKEDVDAAIGDYADFFGGINHAFTVGSLFRDPKNALQPNYKHLPVGYHGRASSVFVSGTPVHRPWGKILADLAADPKIPMFTPCRPVDIELELGAVICKANKPGHLVLIDEAAQTIFGYVLMSDWSARDLQTWEYVPLGPFNAKNFATTISPWVVLPDALEAFATAGIENDTEVLPYLREKRRRRNNSHGDKREEPYLVVCSHGGPPHHRRVA